MENLIDFVKKIPVSSDLNEAALGSQVVSNPFDTETNSLDDYQNRSDNATMVKSKSADNTANLGPIIDGQLVNFKKKEESSTEV